MSSTPEHDDTAPGLMSTANLAGDEILTETLTAKNVPYRGPSARTRAGAEPSECFEEGGEIHEAPQSARRGTLYGQWAIVLLYGAIALAMLPFHEPWADEAEPWLIARDLSFVEIIQNVPYAGHPPLWYFLQAPLAKFDFPFVTVGVLNALCTTAAVAVLVFCSPFSLWQKAAASFSLYFVFTYGMVWRNYCLVMLGFFLVAAAHPARERKPLRYALAVALLANGCVPSLIVAALLLGSFVIECLRAQPAAGAWRKWLACLIMAAAVVLPALALIPTDDVHNKAWFHVYNPYAPLKLISGAFIYLGSLEPFRCGLCVLALATVLWDLRRTPSMLVLVIVAFLGWSYVFVFKCPFCSGWHMGLMDMLLIMALWIARAEGHAPSITARIQLGPRWKWTERMTIGEMVLFASLAVSAVDVPQIIVREIVEPFSNAKEMAAMLRSMPAIPTIATYLSAKSQSILPYLPDRQFKFWHMETESFGTFCKETATFEGFKATTQVQLMDVVRRGFPADKPWLLLSVPLPRPDASGYRLVYQSPQPAWAKAFGAENFWLYQPTTSGW